jgi:hypothetical protein
MALAANRPAAPEVEAEASLQPEESEEIGRPPWSPSSPRLAERGALVTFRELIAAI